MKIPAILLGTILSLPLYAQNPDSAIHPFGDTTVINTRGSEIHQSRQIYHVDKLGTIAITAIGAAGSIAADFPIEGKPAISTAEIASLNKNAINGFDSWALRQPIPNFSNYTFYALSVQVVCAALPLTLFFNDEIRKNWGDILLMLLETNAAAVSIYEFSPLGPLFQNKFRPVVYYDNVSLDVRTKSLNRNSFYSGHTAAAAASTFFLAKVYCDYHPDLGMNKLLIYGAASLPPLALGYLRLRALKHFPSDILTGFAIGAACGILVPEFHRIGDRDVSLSFLTSPIQTGVDLRIVLN